MLSESKSSTSDLASSKAKQKRRNRGVTFLQKKKQGSADPTDSTL